MSIGFFTMRISILCIFILVAQLVHADESVPLADVHVHYKWSQVEVTTPAQAIAAMQRNGVKLAVVFGTPPELVLDVKGNEQLRVVHFYQPYLQPFLKANWFRNKKAPLEVEKALKSGLYKGVGEIHVSDGIGPRQDDRIFNEVLSIAGRYQAPVSLHTNASSHIYMQRICSKHSKTTFLWAHAGGLGPDEVGKLLEKCANVYVEFSARDPLKSIGPMVASEQGRLGDGWLELMQRYPQRFMIGSDPIWPISDIDSWHTADTGWQRVDEVYAYHRRWLQTLPAELQKRVAYDNAHTVFTTQ